MFRSTRAAAGAGAVLLAVSTTNAAVLDLTDAGASGTINGAIFQQFTVQPTGSGVIDSFVRIQGREKEAFEQGYNTDRRPLEFDENSSPVFTRSLALGGVPVVMVDGVMYREFMLDVNESAHEPEITLERVQIFLGGAGDLVGYPNLGTLVYDMDAGTDSRVELDYLTSSSGSGKGDMLLLVPDEVFDAPADPFVYLFSVFSNHDAGYEEWAVSTSGGFTPPPPIPEPGGVAGLVACAVLVSRRRRRVAWPTEVATPVRVA